MSCEDEDCDCYRPLWRIAWQRLKLFADGVLGISRRRFARERAERDAAIAARKGETHEQTLDRIARVASGMRQRYPGYPLSVPPWVFRRLCESPGVKLSEVDCGRARFTAVDFAGVQVVASVYLPEDSDGSILSLDGPRYWVKQPQLVITNLGE